MESEENKAPVLGTGIEMPDRVDEEVRAVYDSFWRDLVETDGRMDPAKVMAELHDYRRVMDTFAEVYCEITGGRLSKLLYEPRVYVDQFNDVAAEWYKENVGDYFTPALRPRLWEIRHTGEIPGQSDDEELQDGEWCLEWIEGTCVPNGWLIGCYALPAPSALLAWMDAEGAVHPCEDDPDVLAHARLFDSEEDALRAFRIAEG